MPKPIRFEGKTYIVPDDATEAEIEEIVSAGTTPPAPEKERTWGDTASDVGGYLKETASNVPGSAMKASGNMLKGVWAMSPPGQAQAYASRVAAGAGPPTTKGVIEGAKEAGGEMVERFSDPLETFKKDPVGMGLDVAAVVAPARGAVDLVGRGLEKGGASLLRRTLKPTQTLQRQFPGTDWGRELGEAGINVTRGGVTKATAEIDDALFQVGELERAAAASGMQARMQTVLTPVVNMIRTAATNPGVMPAVRQEMTRIARDFFQNVQRINPAGGGRTVPIENLHRAKTTLGELSANARKANAPPSTADVYEALRTGAKEGIEEAVPGVQELNAKAANRIKLRDAVKYRLGTTENADPLGLAGAIGLARGGITPENLAKIAGSQAARSPMLRSHGGMSLYRGGRALTGNVPDWLKALFAMSVAEETGNAK